jgi:GT2 family glycosyltransferase
MRTPTRLVGQFFQALSGKRLVHLGGSDEVSKAGRELAETLLYARFEMEAEATEPPCEVDVVVVSYNSAETLRACVEPLAGERGVNVVVVDNASPDDGLSTVEDLPLTTRPAGSNRGFAAGCNLGWRQGSAPAVLFLNPDARILADDVRRLAAVLRDPGVGIAAPRILGDDGALQFSLRRFPTLRSTYAQALFLHRVSPGSSWGDEVMRDPDAYASARAVDWASGACLLVRRALLETLDGLDEGFFMYCEDTDLCKRAADAGSVVAYEPLATATHLGGRSAPRASLLPVLAESRCRYAWKHQSRGAAFLTRAGVALGAVTHLLISRGGAAARVGQLRSLRVAIRPAVDAR